MRIKLAGTRGKRTFSVIRMLRNKADFAPSYITNYLRKADDFVIQKNLSTNALGIEWAPFVLLDDGEWLLVTPEFRNFFKEEEPSLPVSFVNISQSVN